MIPLRDTIRSKTFPYVNYALITLCGGMFLLEISLGERVEWVIRTYGATPVYISSTLFSGHFALRPLMTLFTSMFLHGGWLHLMGNMLYLYIFGDNVEDRLGHRGYLIFYLAAGAGAVLTEVWFHQGSYEPLIAASGAIAGVLGAYFILYPKSRILTMIPLFVFFPVFEVSAFFFLGFWILLQFLEGWLTTGAGAAASGGVAWWAHAGGFVAGAVLLPIFLLARRAR